MFWLCEMAGVCSRQFLHMVQPCMNCMQNASSYRHKLLGTRKMRIFIFDPVPVFRRCQDIMIQGQHTCWATRTSFEKLLVEEGLLYRTMNSLYHYVCYQINFYYPSCYNYFLVPRKFSVFLKKQTLSDLKIPLQSLTSAFWILLQRQI